MVKRKPESSGDCFNEEGRSTAPDAANRKIKLRNDLRTWQGEH